MQKKSKNIILIGMPGSGKTTVAAKLAGLLNLKFIDLDDVIENKYGKIAEIFTQNGEEYFRNLETKELTNLIGEQDFVLSTGGGIVLKDENLQILKKLGRVFYLSAEPETIYQRVKNQTHRPLLNSENPKDSIEKIFNSRIEKYMHSGEKIVTDNKTTEQIAGEIHEKFNC